VALFEDEQLLEDHEVEHPADSLAGLSRLWDQFRLRLDTVLELLAETGVETGDLHAVVGRGGLLRPLPGGTYVVNQAMLDDARANLQGEHPSNLGCALADEIARRGSARAYVVDPVSVDESGPLASYSGLARIRRRTLSHALSVRACAQWLAMDLD
jgi:butyrate kinase